MKWVFKTEYQPPPARPAKAVSLKKICCFFCCPAPFPAILPCSDCSSKWGEKFSCPSVWHFWFLSVVRSKEKISRFVWQISKRGGVGSERKNSLPRRLPKSCCPDYRGKRKFEKIPVQRVAGGLWNVSLAEREKGRPTAGQKPCPVRSMYGKTRQGQSAAVLEQDSTAVPKFAFRSFCPCGNLVGECLPQTLLMRLAPLKNPSKYFSDFSKTVPLHTLFFSY